MTTQGNVLLVLGGNRWRRTRSRHYPTRLGKGEWDEAIIGRGKLRRRVHDQLRQYRMTGGAQQPTRHCRMILGCVVAMKRLMVYAVMEENAHAQDARDKESSQPGSS